MLLLLIVMFECVTSHRCVLQTSADICLLRQGVLCCDLGCVSFLRSQTHIRVHARTCLRCKQRTQAMASNCAHTCVLHKQGIRGHASNCLDCVLIAHARAVACVLQEQGAEATMSQAVLL